jgi:dTDP-N-acetylfucosamine:lipid II N-acetylfucosaminyltransferase
MNYHLVIDHWLINDFIDTAERVDPSNNVYILSNAAPYKYINTNFCIVAGFGSVELSDIISKIQKNDRLFIHWFQNRVIDVVTKLPKETMVYLLFWGGDLIGQTDEFLRFNYDRLTKRYLKNLGFSNWYLFPRKVFSNATSLLKSLITVDGNMKIDVAIRKSLMARVNYFCHWNPLDLNVVVSAYGGKPQFRYFFYDPKLALTPLGGLNSAVEKSNCVVWLGNSDTATNNHLDAIKALSKFRNNDIQVVCPLSYSVDVVYGNYITDVGNETFDKKWISLRQFLSLDEYMEMQNRSDVVIMFHNRTQAAGNVFALIKMGKKVFLKRQSTLYNFLKKHAIVVFDANSINELSFEQFSSPLSPDQAKLNSQTIGGLFSDEKKLEYYKSILC